MKKHVFEKKRQIHYYFSLQPGHIKPNSAYRLKKDNPDYCN